MGPRTGRVLAALTALVLLAGGAAGASTAADEAIADEAPTTTWERSAPAVEDVDLTPRPIVGYRNGRRLPLKVVTIGWAEVEVRTAKAFLAMRDAAAAQNVELWIRNGFRHQEHQVWLYEAWRAGWGNRAARPGFSNHQSGRALDLYVRDPAIRAWLESNASRFGFKRTVPGEPWHWEYDRALERRMVARAARAARIAKARAAKAAKSAKSKAMARPAAPSPRPSPRPSIDRP
jgi:hypothetical protein